jgi:hypothetical protein
MLTFLTLCLLAIVVVPLMGIALIGALVGGLVWIVMFPIRLLFRILFGVVGVGLGLLFMPFILALVASWSWWRSWSRPSRRWRLSCRSPRSG